MAQEEKEYLGPSLDPDDALAGGLFDNKDGRIAAIAFEMFDYQGKADPAPVCSVTIEGEGMDEPIVQKYSVGSVEFWAPTPDGKWIVPVGSEREIRKTSNLNLLIQSLKEGGMPMSLLKGRDVSALVGLVAHWQRKEITGRDDLRKGQAATKRRGSDGKEYERDNKVLLVERVISLPGEGETTEAAPAAPAAKKGKAAAKKTETAKTESPKAAAGPSEAARDMARDIITKQVVEGGGKAAKRELPNVIFKALATDPNRNSVLSLVLTNESIIGLGGFAIDDKGDISLV